MNPYLKFYRLQDVVAALQIMGSYQKYKMSVEEWNKQIENKPLSADTWSEVFEQHPEFFRKNDQGLFSLMWRKGMPHTEGSSSRKPLDTDQISALMDTALQFHAKAVEKQRDKRWWIPILAALLGFLGAIIGASIKK